MGHYDGERERQQLDADRAPVAWVEDERSSVAEMFGKWIGVGAAVLGLVILIAGMIFGLTALNEAWGLYKEPERIERIAAAVERGSNVDRTVQSAVSADAPADGIKVSYLLAWFVATAMLFVSGALSFWAVTAGGSLALRALERNDKPKRTK